MGGHQTQGATDLPWLGDADNEMKAERLCDDFNISSRLTIFVSRMRSLEDEARELGAAAKPSKATQTPNSADFVENDICAESAALVLESNTIRLDICAESAALALEFNTIRLDICAGSAALALESNTIRLDICAESAAFASESNTIRLDICAESAALALESNTKSYRKRSLGAEGATHVVQALENNTILEQLNVESTVLSVPMAQRRCGCGPDP